ncbi:Uncharacterised protein [Shigella sonnei]|nr:Uncharacterised protein [Shigella sonnei]
MIRPRPVECRPLHQQNFFLQQEIQHHFLIVVNVKAFGVDFREHIQRTTRFHAGNARNIVDQFPRAVTLLIKTTARGNKFTDALITTQRGLNGVLRRNVSTQAH